MEGKIKYQRYYLILAQEDSGFGSGNEPSGHIKIEVRDGKGKLAASIQNIKEDKDGLQYKLCIIKCSETQIMPLSIGYIRLQKNRGELNWEFDPNDVALTGSTIDEFNMAVVLAEYRDNRNTEIICPLAAYKDNKINWRDRARDVLYPKEVKISETEEEILKKEDISSRFEGKLESRYTGIAEDSKSSTVDVLRETDAHDSEGANAADEYIAAAEEKKSDEGVRPDGQEDIQRDDEQKLQKDRANAADTALRSEYTSFEQIKEMIDKDAGQDTQNGQTRDIPECKLKTDGICPSIKNSPGVNPCAACCSQNACKAQARPPQGKSDMEKLRISFDRYFKIFEPFQNRRRDYKWWKVNSPVYLNNILFQNSIKTPILFNPSVMMAHFKYRHLIVGIYTDRVKRKQYVVCGVPGVYNIDEKPFGEISKWVQLEGSRPKYGAFGYWLAYIDTENGSFLST